MCKNCGESATVMTCDGVTHELECARCGATVDAEALCDHADAPAPVPQFEPDGQRRLF
jgi:hypothetical protein